MSVFPGRVLFVDQLENNKMYRIVKVVDIHNILLTLEKEDDTRIGALFRREWFPGSNSSFIDNIAAMVGMSFTFLDSRILFLQGDMQNNIKKNMVEHIESIVF